jgi:hypothetical protein
MERDVDCGLPQSHLIRKNKPMSNAQINDTKSWQLAQAQTMIDLFTAARGRAPNTKDELSQFLEEECAAGRIPDGPIQPSTAALLKVAKNGRLV